MSMNALQALDLFQDTDEDFVALWAYTFYAGELGFVHGVFVELASNVETVIGEEIDMTNLFPDAKDEVNATMRHDDFQIISVNEETIQIAESRGLVGGFNPVELLLDFLDEQIADSEALKSEA